MNNSFEELIQLALDVEPKPHLYALAILCQGYLAACGIIKLPDGISITAKKKNLTTKKDWWEPAMGDGDTFETTQLYSEMTFIHKDTSYVKSLFDAITGGVVSATIVRAALESINSDKSCV